MIQFYCPDIENLPVLGESDSGHAVRVLRMRQGDTLRVIDGKGTAYDCVLADAHPKHAALEVMARHPMPLPWQGEITVAVAPTKMMDRMEWMVEKLTEIGVNRIIPMLCARSERREIKRERLEKVAIAAMKQSLKAVLPEILPMTPIAQVLATYAPLPEPGIDCHASQAFMGYCHPSLPRRELACAAKGATSTLLMIGPEGDFTPEEVQAAIAAGVEPVTFGPCRLRTETAALASLQTLHTLTLLHPA